MKTRNLDIFRGLHDAFNRREFEQLDKFMSPNFVYHDTSRHIEFKGREEYKEFLSSWVKGFSNAKVTDSHYIDAGNFVICQFTGTGKNDGVFGTLPATGKEMAIPFCEIIEFDEMGKIVSGKIYYDQLSLLSQLGHVQKPLEEAA